MSALILRSRYQGHTTLVENEFIDHYMAAANGEFVKVYLLLLRHMNNPCASLSISQLADYLEHTESDIIRALKYWEKEGLLTLEYDAAEHVTGIELGRVPKTGGAARTGSGSADPAALSAASAAVSPSGSSAASAAVSSSGSSDASAADKSGPALSAEPSAARRKSAVNRRELKQLLFITEQYLGKTLTRTDVDMITYFYDTLGFSSDLIEYLIEYCVENGHKSMHYIQKVALSWADEHITSVEQARSSSALYNKVCYSVLNAFGIKGRGPAAAELEFIRKWTEQDAFDLELILEACNRTVKAIHQPGFEYTDKILENWKNSKVHTLSDVRILDSAYEQGKSVPKAASRRSAASSGQSASKFRNFEERSYDMDELTRELLRSN